MKSKIGEDGTVPVKKKFPLRSSKMLQSRFHVGKKTLND